MVDIRYVPAGASTPAAAGGQAEHPRTVQTHSLEAAARVHETPHPGSGPRRASARPRVHHADPGQAFPHPQVMSRDRVFDRRHDRRSYLSAKGWALTGRHRDVCIFKERLDVSSWLCFSSRTGPTVPEPEE